MNVMSKVLLVLLRVAIGWHFFFEGVEKLSTLGDGKKPWSGEVYLRESSGPFSPFFRSQAGDPDADAVAKLRVTLPPEKVEAGFAKLLPPALDRAWDRAAGRFVTYYVDGYRRYIEDRERALRKDLESLPADEAVARARIEGKLAGLKKDLDDWTPGLEAEQKSLAAKKLEQAKEQLARWLVQGTVTVKHSFQTADVEQTVSVQDRVKDLEKQLHTVREEMPRTMWLFGHDVEKEKLRAAKAELTKTRTELMNAVDAEGVKLKESLTEILTPGQKSMPALTDPSPERLTAAADRVIIYGLLIAGGCLMLGFLARPAAVAAAVFLLLVYLSMPPFPWLPDNPKAEGHYVFVNKNLIELIALLALATLPTGRWAGIDGLLASLFTRRVPAGRPADDGVVPAATADATGTAGVSNPAEPVQPATPHQPPTQV